MKSALIIGGGFAGCAMAHQFALMGGWDVTLVERLPYLGAGVRTFFNGGHPYTFGPRHFLTPHNHIFRYLNGVVPMRLCPAHQFLTYVETDSAFYNYPIHADDIPRMPEAEQIKREVLEASKGPAQNLEEFWINSVGETLYRKFIQGYSQKMWMTPGNEIDDFSWSPKGVTIKEGPRAAWDTAISAYPIARDGYNSYFGLATADAHVIHGKIDWFDPFKRRVKIGEDWLQADVMVSTISPDMLYDRCYGELPYIGRELHLITLPIEYALPEDVYFCYYAGQEKFTRIVEYKKFTHYQSPHTLISLEIPSLFNKLYPMPIKSEMAKAQRYFDLMDDKTFSIGRAGAYLYNVDIDDAIDHAMKVAEKLK